MTSVRPPVLFALVVSSVALGLIAWSFFRSDAGGTVLMVDTRDEVDALLADRTKSGGTADSGLPSDFAFGWQPLDEEVASKYFPALRHGFEFDPYVYVRRPSNAEFSKPFQEHPSGKWLVRSNNLGLRMDADVDEANKLGPRVLVTGDSHVDGVCPNEENFTTLVQAALSTAVPDLEVINAGVGAYHFYNYRGVIERFANLQPDVFVVVVYGGNDFAPSLQLHRYFARRAPAKRDEAANQRLQKDRQIRLGWYPQELNQALYFGANPNEESLAVDLAKAAATEIDQRCRELGARSLFVYLPPASRVRRERFAEMRSELIERAGVAEEMLAVSDRLADQWLAALGELGIDFIDLRPAFDAADEDYYWWTDHHINSAGHRALADVLGPKLRTWLD